MDNYSFPLDEVFLALGDPTRRAIVNRLVFGRASVKELAAPMAMALPSVLKHLRVLERGGLVRSQKIGRTRLCELEPAALRTAEAWMAQQRAMWEAHADRLEAYVEALHTLEQADGP
ncbi:MAG: helix-turn-helix transcriptional regulator [Burkholderiaceae bacterium]|nr:helix-turn-helix transcriptional regulator [Burkholderiaceae bacterium]MBP6815706.1 helix-turn-helix transcriptional regulator [Burkholderiaceae bacterium]